MNNLQLYNKLLQFNLFQGMSKDDLAQIVTRIRLGFHKFAPGETLATNDTPCTQLFFLVEGEIQIHTHATNHAYTIIEKTHHPAVFQPESLFGIHPRFSHSYIAYTPCSIITIDKAEVTKLFESFPIFRINFLNQLSTRIQKGHIRTWREAPTTTRQRIIRFFESHCLHPAGEKQCRILMRQLAEEIGTKRLYVSQALNTLQQEGKIVLRRGCIDIPALEKLLM